LRKWKLQRKHILPKKSPQKTINVSTKLQQQQERLSKILRAKQLSEERKTKAKETCTKQCWMKVKT